LKAVDEGNGLSGEVLAGGRHVAAARRVHLQLEVFRYRGLERHITELVARAVGEFAEQMSLGGISWLRLGHFNGDCEAILIICNHDGSGTWRQGA
jgi:hypothetical protein